MEAPKDIAPSAHVDVNVGLPSAEVAARLERYGHNVIEEKQQSMWRRIVSKIVSPMSIMFLAAGGLSLWSGEGGDTVIILILFLVNMGVSVWQEAKADTALEKLKEKLMVMVKVKRDGNWKRLPSAELVPGDIIGLSVGDVLPADVSFTSVKNVSVNEAVVTGESLPKQKMVGDSSYSGAFLATGLAEALVTATGNRTYFGKTLKLVENIRRRSSLEQDILSVSRFLSMISISVLIVLTVVLIFLEHLPIAQIAILDVSMLIAGIPVALPTVMTLIISIGVTELASKAVIVRRLSSLEDLANVNLLLSDKTGTLTENKIKVVKMIPLAANVSEQDIWMLAVTVSAPDDTNPLESAVQAKAAELGVITAPVPLDYIPGDSDRKRATAIIARGETRRAVSIGAPQTIKDLSILTADEVVTYDKLVAEAATEGFRVLTLAEAPGEREEKMHILAVFFLADAVRVDAKETISFMANHGIAVKMVTGDGHDVGAHVARELGIAGDIVRRAELEAGSEALKGRFASPAALAHVAGFAEVMPKNKYEIVMAAKSAIPPYVVAATGDGVNDVPPVKAADVGIAVANAVDALKGTADIVLTQAGIAVIKNAIIEARKVFIRLYNYSVYRISESFRLIITVAVLGLILHSYPLTAIQIILIALLNDLPIISLAFDKVDVPQAPAHLNARQRFTLGLVFGSVGIAESLILVWAGYEVFHLPWLVVQTMFFLKLTVSGHMLIYLAHTNKPWFKFWPSKKVIWATTITQLIASLIAFWGIFTAPIGLVYILIVWGWALVWMQIGEVAKQFTLRLY